MSDPIDIEVTSTPPVEVEVDQAPAVNVSVSPTPINFPQVVEAISDEEENAFFAAGAKIVIRTDLM